jgi:hypothetical protein
MLLTLPRPQMSTSDAGGNSVLFSVGTTGRTLESLGGVVLGVDANDHAVGIYGSRVVKTLPPRNHDDDSTYRVPMNSQALRTLLFTASPSESRIYLDCILVASETAALGTLSTLDTAAIGAAKDVSKVRAMLLRRPLSLCTREQGSAGVLGFSGALDSLIVVPRALTNDEALRALKFYKKSQQPLNHTAGKCPNECFHSEDTRTTHGDCVLVGTEYKCQVRRLRLRSPARPRIALRLAHASRDRSAAAATRAATARSEWFRLTARRLRCGLCSASWWPS